MTIDLSHIEPGLRDLAVPISDLKPNLRQVNTHDDRNIDAIARSLRVHGQKKNAVANKQGEMIAGWGTVLAAAERLGWTHLAVVFSDEDEQGLDEYALEDNRTAALAKSDDQRLLAELGRLDELGAKPEDLGWTAEEMAALREMVGGDGDEGDGGAGCGDESPQTDKAEELRREWGVELGQLWRLGEHRLLCGDCTDQVASDRLGSVNVVFTDPPYGIDYDPAFLEEIGKRHNRRLSSTRKVVSDDGSLDLSFLWKYKKRMIWGFPYIYDFQATGWIVWDKQPGVDHRGIVTPVEIASTTMRKGFDLVRVMWGGYYRAAGEVRQPHPTQKPLGVIVPFVEAWTKEDEIIYDPFSGSGTTIIACEQLGRRCRAIEIDPGYVAVTLQRYLDATGKQPEIAR
jgi:hypothetical protein